MIRSLIFVTLMTSVYCYNAKTPLIKNIFRGGQHSEGPHWSTSENALYWVDIAGQKVHRFDIETGNVTTRSVDYGPVSLVVSVKDYPGMVAITVRSEVYLMSWDNENGDEALRLLSAVDVGLPNNRCNDGKVDVMGRLWFGTMGKEVDGNVDKDQGSLYVMEQGKLPMVKVRPASVSNGIAWTSDSKFMFYIDSPTKNIDVFDFDAAAASLRNRRTLFSFQANNVSGVPDGMTIDSDGNLWVACFGGGKVIKVDSRSGRLLEQHKLPADRVTSVMFGGHDLSTLFVTTSRFGLKPSEFARQPEAGSLFAIEGTGAKGLPENQFVFANADTY